MKSTTFARLVAALPLVAVPALASAQAPALNRYGNPATLAPAPTAPEITARDLQIRLYQFADDSMQGRQVGRLGNQKGTDFIAAEVQRLGLLPAGDDGTYFQVLPYRLRKFTAHSRLVDACVGFESRSRLHQVRCPTLVIHAALDQVTSPRTTLPIERSIPGAIGETWDDLAHVVAGKEQKIRFAARLFDWLAST